MIAIYSRELLCFGKSCCVPEGSCLLCASGYSWLLVSPARGSICTQQQCLQGAFGLIFLGSEVLPLDQLWSCWGQSHGAAGGGNLHREVDVCAMLMYQCKGKAAGSMEGEAASFTLCPVPGTCIRQVLSHTFEKLF